MSDQRDEIHWLRRIASDVHACTQELSEAAERYKDRCDVEKILHAIDLAKDFQRDIEVCIDRLMEELAGTDE